MAKLIIETEVVHRGDAQNFLREVIRELDKGYAKGPGWEFETGEVKEEAAEKNDALPCGGCTLEEQKLAGEDIGDKQIIHRKECAKFDPEVKREKKEPSSGGVRLPWQKKHAPDTTGSGTGE